MTPDVIRVMYADDNELLASAMQRRLSNEPRFSWVGWVGNGAELVARVARARPDILLLDIEMPGYDSFKAIGEVMTTSPRTRVVMFSGHLQRDMIDRAIDAGAWGYVSKHDQVEDMLRVIEDVMQGRFGISHEALLEQRELS